jgi:hypothetical protein
MKISNTILSFLQTLHSFSNINASKASFEIRLFNVGHLPCFFKYLGCEDGQFISRQGRASKCSDAAAERRSKGGKMFVILYRRKFST